MRKLANPQLFFNLARGTVFAGRMSQSEVDGCDAILKACGDADWSMAWTAYGLATAFHETNSTMQPVREAYWLDEDYRRRHLRYYPHYGRGYVQLTWPANYQRADTELGLGGKLINNLDLALEPDIAAKVMVKGMAEGWFSTGHMLVRHLPEPIGTNEQFVDARRIINGTDRAGNIADYAMEFQAALTAGGWA